MRKEASSAASASVMGSISGSVLSLHAPSAMAAARVRIPTLFLCMARLL